MSDAEAVFRTIYRTAHWEGGSGQGSRADVTAPYRRILEVLVRSTDVSSVVDAGCGDWEFAQLVDWSGVRYLGLDVVPEVVAANQASFAGPDVEFRTHDLLTEPPPPADLLLCKDVLQHWPVDRVRWFLGEVVPRYRYALLTNDIASVHWPEEQSNVDIELGAWRTVDLEQPPFGLSPVWQHDYDIRGEWTKRALLLVRRRHRLRAAVQPGSALRRLRRADWR